MAEHAWGPFYWCERCGAGRHEVEDNLRPIECQGAPNVVAISEKLAERHFAPLLEAIQRKL